MESPKVFGLLDINVMPSPTHEPRPNKGGGHSKPVAPSKTNAAAKGRGQDKKKQSATGQKAQPSSASYEGRGQDNDKKSYPKWRFLTLEEEARRKRMEFDGYKAEARIRSMAGNYDKAIDLYSKALELEPRDKLCRVALATCHFQVGNFQQAVQDADKAIKQDPNMAKAIYVKAEALYQKGVFEMALVCYYRAKKIRPGAPEYDRGIQKARSAIENCIGEYSNIKLERMGDLTYFDEQNRRDDKSTELTVNKSNSALKAGLSAVANDKQKAKKNAKTVKQMLGELYGDWQYLESILADEEVLLEKMQIEDASEEIKRRKLLREKRETLRGNNTAIEDDDEKLIPRDTFTYDIKKKKRNLSEKVRSMCQKELAYLDERSEFWRQQKSPQNQRKQNNIESKDAQTRSSMASHTSISNILSSLEEIEESQSTGDYKDSLKQAEELLKNVEKISNDETLLRKTKIAATLHSLIGNAHYELGNFDESLFHYKEDMKIAEENDLVEAKSRALGNIGRAYVRKASYREAIATFEKKVPYLSKSLDATWLYHELGRCHLELEHFRKAEEYGELALTAAIDAEDSAWQLNANMLIAQAQVELEKYDTALSTFEKALLVVDQDDNEAVAAIQKAISNVRERKEHSEQV